MCPPVATRQPHQEQIAGLMTLGRQGTGTTWEVRRMRAQSEAHPSRLHAASNSLRPMVFTLRTKGPVGLAERVATVTTRFGPTPRLMLRRLEKMLELTSAVGFGPSCPIPASVLARHPDSVLPLVERGMELAIHGLRHNDHLVESAATQSREVAAAFQLFERCGLAPKGFRAPYLRSNAATASAVRAVGLAYESDAAVAFPVDGLEADSVRLGGYDRALAMYDAADGRLVTSRPSVVDGLVQIPVVIPDDEMLVDRLHLPGWACARVWRSIFDTTHARGDLFTMQIHPERIDRSAPAVAAVLQHALASTERVWFARLDEIADWWIARNACEVEIRPLDDQQAEFVVLGDPRVRMSLVGGSGPAAPETSHRRRMVLSTDPFPMVAVEPGTPDGVRRSLRDDGYLVDSRWPSPTCAVKLPRTTDVNDELAIRRRITAPENPPVLALDRWPDGHQSALAVTGDIDALTVQDFWHRVRENGRPLTATDERPVQL
jgi:peptidoglycan/xylan/chitin deacetylase (PgdA/CDA1 family)